MNKYISKLASVAAIIITIINGEVHENAISLYHSSLLFFASKANQTFVYLKQSFVSRVAGAASTVAPLILINNDPIDNTAVII